MDLVHRKSIKLPFYPWAWSHKIHQHGKQKISFFSSSNPWNYSSTLLLHLTIWKRLVIQFHLFTWILYRTVPPEPPESIMVYQSAAILDTDFYQGENGIQFTSNWVLAGCQQRLGLWHAMERALIRLPHYVNLIPNFIIRVLIPVPCPQRPSLILHLQNK